MAPMIFIFSIVLGAKYLSYVKFIAIYALTFFGYIISVIASVLNVRHHTTVSVELGFMWVFEFHELKILKLTDLSPCVKKLSITSVQKYFIHYISVICTKIISC